MQFSYTLPKTKLDHFFVQISLLCYLGPKWGASSLYFSLRSKFHKITLVLNFWAVFVHFAQNETCPFCFCPNYVILLYYLGTKWGASGRCYCLWSKFRKITLILKFQTVFVHFAQNQICPFFVIQVSLLSYLGTK